MEGYLVDRFGPRPVVLVGGLLCGIGWVMNSYADSLTMLYVAAAAVGGIGAGAVYGTCVGNALKWFPDRRGLAAGLTAAGFGAGSAMTIIPIQAIIKSMGYQTAFLYFGIAQGLIVMMVAMALTDPRRVLSSRAGEDGPEPIVNPRIPQTGRDYRPLEMIRQPVFWVMYVMFVLVAAGGLMAVAQLAPIAKDFKISDIPVSILGLTLPALTFRADDRSRFERHHAPVLRLGFRPHRPRVDDADRLFLGRRSASCASTGSARSPWHSVVLSGLVFFAWGEIYSLFPSTNADTFGSKFAAANAGLLYTAKGTASLARSPFECANRGDRQLACGVRGLQQP